MQLNRKLLQLRVKERMVPKTAATRAAPAAKRAATRRPQGSTQKKSANQTPMKFCFASTAPAAKPPAAVAHASRLPSVVKSTRHNAKPANAKPGASACAQEAVEHNAVLKSVKSTAAATTSAACIGVTSQHRIARYPSATKGIK